MLDNSPSYGCSSWSADRFGYLSAVVIEALALKSTPKTAARPAAILRRALNNGSATSGSFPECYRATVNAGL